MKSDELREKSGVTGEYEGVDWTHIRFGGVTEGRPVPGDEPGRACEPKAICLDCETTGIDPYEDEILTLSIVDWAGETLYDGRFKPARRTEWPGAERVNGISPESVAQCPPISRDLEEIQGIVDSADEVIGYNIIHFDQRFMEAAGVRFGRKAIRDTMLEYAELAGDWDDYHQDWRWWRLTEAADAIGYEWTAAAHGSLADALATLAVQKWVERERGLER